MSNREDARMQENATQPRLSRIPVATLANLGSAFTEVSTEVWCNTGSKQPAPTTRRTATPTSASSVAAPLTPRWSQNED